MSEKITARLQTPADETGARKDVHLVTTTDEVIVYPDAEEPITGSDWVEKVDDKLKTIDGVMGVAISNKVPEKKDVVQQGVLWFKPITQ